MDGGELLLVLRVRFQLGDELFGERATGNEYPEEKF
jgi:hypothetical protein